MPLRRYGSIFSIMVGTKPLVVLNSYKLIKEALSKAEFSGRPNMFSGTFFQKGKTGVCTTEGSTWESQRSFLHSQMAQFASSKAFQVKCVSHNKSLSIYHMYIYIFDRKW